MNCRDIKKLYTGLIDQRGKLSNKRGWIDRRIQEIADPKLIYKLTDEGLAVDSKSRDIDIKISQLEASYKFLKHRQGAVNV